MVNKVVKRNLVFFLSNFRRQYLGKSLQDLLETYLVNQGKHKENILRMQTLNCTPNSEYVEIPATQQWGRIGPLVRGTLKYFEGSYFPASIRDLAHNLVAYRISHFCPFQFKNILVLFPCRFLYIELYQHGARVNRLYDKTLTL